MLQDWFTHAKLGIFIHWGIYAVEGVSESWSFHNGVISYEDYMAQKSGFTAEHYDPEAWARLFKEAGATYAVLTTKHHDGVALWDTRLSSSSVVRETPAGRDLLRPYAEALRAEGLRVGFYYSLIDWSREDYRAVYQEGTDPRTWAEQNPFSTPAGGPEDPALWEEFLKFNDGQMTELLTEYGPVDLLWFDGDWERSAEQWKMKDFRDLIYRCQPNVVLNSRMQGYGDYKTPEQGMPVSRPQGMWELCTTINESWGYQGRDQAWKSTRQLLRMLCDCLTYGGNMLLGIGPRADGTIPEPEVQRLKEMGTWIRDHEEAIYETGPGLDYRFFLGGSTLSPDQKTLYLFVYDPPKESVCLKGLQNKVRSIEVLHSGERLDWSITGGAPWNNIPGTMWIGLDESSCRADGPTVLKLELEGPLRLYDGEGQAISFND